MFFPSRALSGIQFVWRSPWWQNIALNYQVTCWCARSSKVPFYYISSYIHWLLCLLMQACNHCMSLVAPLHWPVAGIWLELDAIRVIWRGRRGVGGAPFTGDWMKKGRIMTSVTCWNMHYIIYGVISTLPFRLSLWFLQHNTAITIPSIVMVATHSATKEAVVAMKTPEERAASSQAIPS